MPGPSISDILVRLHDQKTNQETPVVFITKSDDFESKALEATSGGYDILGKPLVVPELVVKVLTYMLRDRLTTIAMEF